MDGFVIYPHSIVIDGNYIKLLRGTCMTENILIKKDKFPNMIYYTSELKNFHTKHILEQLDLKFIEDNDNFIIDKKQINTQ